MTKRRRDMFFRVMDGYTSLLGLMSIMDQRPDCDHILGWLIANRYTGYNLEQWYIANFAPDPKKLFRHIYQNPGKLVILK